MLTRTSGTCALPSLTLRNHSAMNIPLEGDRIAFIHLRSMFRSACRMGYALAVDIRSAPGDSELVVTIIPDCAPSAWMSAQSAFTTTFDTFLRCRLH